MSLQIIRPPDCACTSFRKVLRLDARAAISPNAKQLRWTKILAVIATTPRHRALFAFRLAHWLHSKGSKLPARLIQAHIQRIAGAEIHPGAHIAGGLVLVHSVGVVVGERVVAGQNLRVHQNVTIGERGDGPGQPEIGNNVNLGAGAVLLGDIRIGNGVVVGANTVVTKDVADDVVVAGSESRERHAIRI